MKKLEILKLRKLNEGLNLKDENKLLEENEARRMCKSCEKLKANLSACYVLVVVGFAAIIILCAYAYGLLEDNNQEYARTIDALMKLSSCSEQSKLANYTYPLVVDTQKLIRYRVIRPDCSDIRFTIGACDAKEIEIDYVFVREECNTNKTTFWLKANLSTMHTNCLTMYSSNKIFRMRFFR